jgi:predicted GIY-YIG superfamily endonuclease
VRNEDDKMFSNNLKNNKLEFTLTFGTQHNQTTDAIKAENKMKTTSNK